MNSRHKMVGVALMALGAMTAGVAQAKPVRVPVMATGTASGGDRSSATSEAKDTARSSLVCTGRLEDVDVTSAGCIKLGSDESPTYSCTAIAKAICVIGN